MNIFKRGKQLDAIQAENRINAGVLHAHDDYIISQLKQIRLDIIFICIAIGFICGMVINIYRSVTNDGSGTTNG